MLYHLIYPLHVYLSGLNIFRYITFRSFIAVVISLLFFLFFGKRFIAFMKKNSNRILRKLTPKGHRRKKGTPSMGGILIIMAVSCSILLTGNLQNPNVIMMLIALIGFGLIGFIDDVIKETQKDGKGIASRFKLTAQLVLGLIIAVYLYYFTPNSYIMGLKPSPDTLAVSAESAQTLLQNGKEALQYLGVSEITLPFMNNITIDLGWWYIPFVMLVIVGTSNAVNITDGLDGLAAGLALMIILALTAFAYFSGHSGITYYLKIPFMSRIGEMSVFLAALAGACIGFLWFNCHPAQIFMGDTGSLALGGLIGTAAVLLKIELLLPILGGVFVFEIISVIIQVFSYKTRKKRVFKMAPIHHHFEIKGLNENKIIIRMWIIGGICALIALASLKIR
ncbi:MAG TPA: phospho-N-acetylmuramoyl-pentapeptide-transferase [Spirochaetota bacterium]|nr:phospho-N-acetylmuramoyl-pentapeptide-transferase [Spirochaetota bacterium]